ncbi:MAG: CHRD domain-containing protein [Verrucomicrobiota bacterium]|nr:CHRD domain-containing protein [Verrucomicrobiota bacterium]
MKKILILITILAGLTLAEAQSNFTVSINGAQETPPSGSPGIGSGTLTLNVGNTLSYNVGYSGLTSAFSAAHIHGPAAPGVAAGILFSLNNTPITTTSGTLSGTTVALNPAQVTDLQSSLFYVNIHSGQFPGGEIRGQILPVPEPSTLALAGVGIGALFFGLRRKG